MCRDWARQPRESDMKSCPRSEAAKPHGRQTLRQTHPDQDLEPGAPVASDSAHLLSKPRRSWQLLQRGVFSNTSICNLFAVHFNAHHGVLLMPRPKMPCKSFLEIGCTNLILHTDWWKGRCMIRYPSLTPVGFQGGGRRVKVDGFLFLPRGGDPG